MRVNVKIWILDDSAADAFFISELWRKYFLALFR